MSGNVPSLFEDVNLNDNNNDNINGDNDYETLTLPPPIVKEKTTRRKSLFPGNF